MKKWLAGIALLGIIALTLVYTLIPSQISISRLTHAVCTSTGANRILNDQANWGKFWPGTITSHGPQSYPVLTYNDLTYQLNKAIFDAYEIHITSGTVETNSLITTVPIKIDSLAIEWRAFIRSSSNPITRIRQYRKAVRISENMSVILDSMKSFLSNRENIYRRNINHQLVEDTALISTKKIFDSFPSTTQIYNAIGKLQSFALAKKIEQTNPPMMHVQRLAGNKFEMMVAIPINKEIADEGEYKFKRMVRGNLLVTIVTGGNASVQQALTEMEHFKADYKMVSPAIPYESLITDRLKESDSSKWKTKIYYPIF